MSTSIVSAEARARLTEAVKNYMPPAPEKYRALNEVKDAIVELRNKKASYQTIHAMLHDNAGIEVSHQTIARYCREMLKSPDKKKGCHSRTATDGEQKKSRSAPATGSLFHTARSSGPRIADVKSL